MGVADAMIEADVALRRHGSFPGLHVVLFFLRSTGMSAWASSATPCAQCITVCR